MLQLTFPKCYLCPQPEQGLAIGHIIRSVNQTARYASLKIHYPPILYTALLMVYFNDQLQHAVVPLETFTDSTHASAYLHEIAQAVTDRNPEVQVSSQSLLAELQYDSEQPLFPHYWSTPTLEYRTQDRLRLMFEFFEHPEFYQLLITPFLDTDHQVHFQSAIPLSSPASHDLENFMLMSDWPVEITAKSIALYRPLRVYGFDWLSGEEIPLSPPLPDPIVH